MKLAVVAWIALSAAAQQPPPAAAPAPVVVQRRVLIKQQAAEQAADNEARAAAENDATEETAGQSPDLSPSAPDGPSVYTIRDERIAAEVAAVEAGRLVLATEPPRTIAFDEVLRIEPGPASTSALSAEWLGQHSQLKATAGGTAPAVASAAGPVVTVHLEHDDLLHGNLLELTAETARLRTIWEQEVELPLIEVLGIRFDDVHNDAGENMFRDQLASPGGEDTALVVSRDMNAAEVAGSCLGASEGKLQFRFNEQTRSINLDRLVGIVFAAHPPVRARAAMRQVVEFVNGDRVSGVLSAVSADALELQLAGGKSLVLPCEAVRQVTFKNGRLVYLSDLEPLSVEEVPYFGRTWQYRQDAALDGGPLVIGGAEYKKGLAVHSRCVLRYALDGQYELFKTRIGFDDTAAGRGAVACRVLADGRELFAEPDLRADADPVEIEVSIAGAGELTLEIDFGPREDTGDRVIWASARILRGDEPEAR